jgi:hypothetical protein
LRLREERSQGVNEKPAPGEGGFAEGAKLFTERGPKGNCKNSLPYF